MSNIVIPQQFETLEVSNGYNLSLVEDGHYSISLNKDVDKEYEFFPSRIASNVIGLKIHEWWDFCFLQNSTKRKYTGFSKRKYNELIIRNPRLLDLHNNICKDDERKQKNLWHGAISRYNADDISYFLSFEYLDRPASVMEGQRGLENHLKFSFQFVMSPKTINGITRALNNGDIKKIDLSLRKLDFYNAELV